MKYDNQLQDFWARNNFSWYPELRNDMTKKDDRIFEKTHKEELAADEEKLEKDTNFTKN